MADAQRHSAHQAMRSRNGGVDLSRDGKWLAVTRGAVTGDMVMMSILKQ